MLVLPKTRRDCHIPRRWNCRKLEGEREKVKVRERKKERDKGMEGEKRRELDCLNFFCLAIAYVAYKVVDIYANFKFLCPVSL